MKLPQVRLHARSKLILVICIFLAVIAGVAWATIAMRQRPINVTIILHDAGSGSVISDGYTVSSGQDNVAKLDAGKFYFAAIAHDAEVSITGPGLYSPVNLNVDNRKNIDVSLNANINNAIEPFVRNLQLRQYRKIYDVMAKAEKDKIGVDIFLKDMNDWQDGFISRGLEVVNINYRIEPDGIERRGELSGTNYQDVTKIILNWKIIGGTKDYNPETAIYFVTEEGQTKWLYEANFLP